MAFPTLLELRTRLNADLALESDTDTKPWGDEEIRNQAIRDGFDRMWPTMRRLQTVTLPYAEKQQVYDLPGFRDLQLIEVEQPGGLVLSEIKNWRAWLIDDDPEVFRVRLATGAYQFGASLVFTGYKRYISTMAIDADECDLALDRVWIPLLGAKSWLYRRRYHEFMDYERWANLNITNAMDPPTLYTAYQSMEQRFLEARAEHSFDVSLPKRHRMTR